MIGLKVSLIVSVAPGTIATAQSDMTFIRGSNEVVLVDGYGPSARNAGAEAATGDMLVFTDDTTELRGTLYPMRYSTTEQRWWTPRSYQCAIQSSRTESVCVGASLCSSIHSPSGSIYPFQAVSTDLFHQVGGYCASTIGYDRYLSRRLAALGNVPSRAPIIAYLFGEYEPRIDPPVPDGGPRVKVLSPIGHEKED